MTDEQRCEMWAEDALLILNRQPLAPELYKELHLRVVGAISRALKLRSVRGGDFAVGDVVELKSGGPRMTVVKIDDDGSVQTQWFVGDFHRDSVGNYPPAALRSSRPD